MNITQISTLVILSMSSLIAMENKDELCEVVVKSMYAAASKNDITELSKVIHPKSYYGNGEYGAKAFMKEILVGTPEILSIKHIGSGKVREYVEVYVNRKDNAAYTPTDERKTVFYIVSLGLTNGEYRVFSSTLVADGVELLNK